MYLLFNSFTLKKLQQTEMKEPFTFIQYNEQSCYSNSRLKVYVYNKKIINNWQKPINFALTQLIKLNIIISFFIANYNK